MTDAPYIGLAGPASPTNASTAAGVLTPVTGQFDLSDAPIDQVFRDIVWRLTGMDGRWVFRRDQDQLPQQPPPTQNWAVVGCEESGFKADRVITHRPEFEGFDVHDVTSSVDVQAVFYGPDSRANADRVNFGLGVHQNREGLRRHRISFVRCERITPANDLVNGQRVRRCDTVLRFGRVSRKVYRIQNIESPCVTFTPGH